MNRRLFIKSLITAGVGITIAPYIKPAPLVIQEFTRFDSLVATTLKVYRKKLRNNILSHNMLHQLLINKNKINIS